MLGELSVFAGTFGLAQEPRYATTATSREAREMIDRLAGNLWWPLNET